MRFARTPVLAIIIALIATLYVPAQSTTLLEPAEWQRLNEAALAEYQLAVRALDHVDRISAIQHLEKALAAQPGHVELAFLMARLAREQARLEFGEEARRYQAMALAAIEQVLRRSDIEQDPLTYDRAVNAQRVINQERNNIETRDQRRMQIGQRFKLDFASENGLPAEVVTGRPRSGPAGDPTAPFNLRTITRPEGAAALPARAPAAPAPAMPALGGSPFGGPAPAAAPSPFGGGGGFRGGAPNPFGGGAAAPNPFGGAPAAAPNPFGGGGAPNPFGGAPAAAPNPFGGGGAPNPFGGAPNPFGGGAAAAPNPFAAGGGK